MKSDTIEKFRKRIIGWLQFGISAVLIAGTGLFIHTRFGVFEECHSVLKLFCFVLILFCALLLFGLLNLAYVGFVLRKTTGGRAEVVLTTVTVVAADAIVLGGIYYIGSELLAIILN